MKKSKFALKIRAITKLATKLVIGGLAAAFVLTAASPALVAVNAAADVPTASTSITQPQTSPAATVVFTIGSTTYTVNGMARQLTAAPFIDGDLTMIPLQAIADVRGAEIIVSANGVFVQIRRRWENGDLSPTVDFSTALRSEAGPPAVMIDGQIFQPLSMRESGSPRFGLAGSWVDSSWRVGDQTITFNITPITFEPPHSVTFANNEGFRVSPDRVPAWILPEQRALGDFVASQFELDVFEELNKLIVESGVRPFTWSDDLSAVARWRAEQGGFSNLNDDPNSPFPSMADILVTRTTRGRVYDVHPNNFTPQAVAEEIFISVGVGRFADTKDETGIGRPRGWRPGLMGVGFDEVGGRVVVRDTVINWYDIIDGEPYFEINNVLGGWVMDSPYFFALAEKYNPHNLMYMLAYGRYNDMTDEEIEEWIIDSWEQEMFRLTNEMRVAHGLNSVAWDDSLGRSARFPISIGTISHRGPNGSTPTDWARREGWRGGGVSENASGPPGSPANAVAAWMTSTGHRRNILNPSHTHMGAGYGHSPGGTMIGWVESSHWSISIHDRQQTGTPIAIQQFGRR